MNRRAFMAGITGVTVFGPIATYAQQLVKAPRRIVILSPVQVRKPAFDAFRAHLHKVGYVENRDIRFEFRSAEGHVERLPALAEALVREGTVDAIVVESTPAAVAARRATKTIPIVANIAVDPVAAGLAVSLARPGGNVTGISLFAEELNAKRVELFRRIAPRGKCIAAISATTSSAANSPGNLRAVEDAAEKLSLRLELIAINDPARLRDELGPAALAGFDGFVLLPDVVLSGYISDVVALLGASGKPAIYANRLHAETGGLISYGQDLIDGYRRLASLLDQVLRGAAPGDVPFERSTKFELVINLRTARALGIDMPQDLLAIADEVIE